MKILIVSHSSDLAHPGGAETAASAQAIYMRTKGHEVTHIACHPELDEDYGYDENSETHLINSVTKTSSFLWNNNRTAILWSERLSEINPDVVHLHHYLNCGILLPAIIKKILPSTKVILTFHEYLAICGRGGQMVDKNGNLCEESGIRKCSSCLDASPKDVAINNSIIKLGLGFVDDFISPSHFLLKRYVNWGIQRSKIHQIENFMKCEEFEIIPAENHVSPTPMIMNFVSQHTPTKGLDILLQAILDLKDISPLTLRKIRFNIWGSGSERWPDNFHQRILELKKLTDGHAHFMGKYNQRDLSRIYSGSSYTIVPSIWWENAPYVIQESLAFGVPVIGSDIGGIAEKISDSPNSLIFPVGNSRALAMAILAASKKSLSLNNVQITLSNPQTYKRHIEIYNKNSNQSDIIDLD